MGENANEKKAATAENKEGTAEKKEKKAKKTDATDMDLTPHEHIAREKKKTRWTLETCRKAASRFDSRDAWKVGAPSSFKAAVSRGWEADCLKALKKGESKTTTTAPTRSKSPTRAA